VHVRGKGTSRLSLSFDRENPSATGKSKRSSARELSIVALVVLVCSLKDDQPNYFCLNAPKRLLLYSHLSILSINIGATMQHMRSKFARPSLKILIAEGTRARSENTGRLKNTGIILGKIIGTETWSNDRRKGRRDEAAGNNSADGTR